MKQIFPRAILISCAVLSFALVAHAQSSISNAVDAANAENAGSSQSSASSNSSGTTIGNAVDQATAQAQQTDQQNTANTIGNAVDQATQQVNAVNQANSQGYVPIVTVPNLLQSTSNLVNSSTTAVFLNNLYEYLVGLAAILAVIEIIWGGLEIAGQDSVTKHTDGRQRIYNALFGLVLILSPALVLSIISPGILNLSVNMPPLDTAATQYSTAPVASTTSQILSGNSTVQGNVQTCAGGSNCQAFVNSCNATAGGSVSTDATLTCYNSSTGQQDNAGVSGSASNVTCPAGETPAVVCTILTGPQ